MKTRIFLLFSISIHFFFACNNAPAEKPQIVIPVEKKVNVGQEISLLIKNYVYLQDIDSTQYLVIAHDNLLSTMFIREFYLYNNYKSVWFNEEVNTQLCDSLYEIIKNSEEYGLLREDYHFTKIDSLMNSKYLNDRRGVNINAIAEAELLLTDAFYTFCVHVSKGRLNKDSLTREWKGNTMDSNFVNRLYIGLEKNNIRSAIDSLEPKTAEYRAVKLVLKDFKNKFKNENWDSIFYESKDSIPFEERLKKRLIASHDYHDEYIGSDEVKLGKAIKNFQCRHHLNEDGKVGKLTYRALQKTKRDYIHQLEMNLECWRLWDKPKDKAYVWINIPSFEMRLIENDSVILESRIIVGRDTAQTPVLHSTINNISIYPYWNVPRKIAVEEILPILKRPPDSLQHKNFELLDGYNNVVTAPVSWKKYNKNYFPFKIRQRIGDDNALGILKFYFTNKKGVYMHDTDNRSLFNLENRALSHGCIRLEKFIDLAKYLIKDDSINYPLNSFKHDLLLEKQKYVYIKHPLPLYTNYFTVEVNKYGETIYLIDVYKRDEKMLNALRTKAKGLTLLKTAQQLQ